MSWRELDIYGATRRRTLERVATLDQKGCDAAPLPGKWSVGEILDHLLRVDRIIVRELEELVGRYRAHGLPVFLRRGFADFDSTLHDISALTSRYVAPRFILQCHIAVPGIPRALLGWLDPAFVLLGIMVPRSLRQVLARDRRVPVQAPTAIRPVAGREVEDLRSELRGWLFRLEKLFAGNEDVPFERLRYFNPLVGLTSALGILSFSASHEGRHLEQLEESLGRI